MAPVRKKIAAVVWLSQNMLTADRIFAAILVMSIAGVCVSAVKPWIAGSLIDDLTGAAATGRFWRMIIGGAAAFLFSEIIFSAEALLSERTRAKTTAHLQGRVLREIYQEPFAAAGLPAGDRMHAVLMDSASAASFMCTAAKDGAVLAFKILLSLALVAWLNPRMALLALALSPLALVSVVRADSRLEARWRARDELEKRAFDRLGENFSKMPTVKALRAERRFLRLDYAALADLARSTVACAASALVRNLASGLIFKVAAGVVSLYGLYQVKAGLVSAGAMTMVMGYLAQLIFAEQELVGICNGASEGLLACGRLHERLRGAGRTDLPLRGAHRAGSWAISFEEVTFAYGADRDVFRGMSFRAQAGQHTALAGPSGCGKTTALFLAAQLLQPQKGTVFAGGRDIAQIAEPDLREQIAVVPQEPLVWDASLADNISFFSSRITAEDFERAVQVAGVDAMCAAMPGGLKTVLSGAGRGISRGQRQRVALARALALRPRLVLLDEALSSLEPESEIRILADIRKNYPETTLVAVSHRPSAMASADCIIWIRSPSQAVCGAPAALFGDPEFAAVYDLPAAG